MAAPVYQSQTSTYLNNATILTASLAVPAGTASGDLLLYLWEVDGDVGLAVPTGFTSGHNSAGAAGGTFTTGWAYRVADGTETTITVETVDGSAERAAVALARITGADTTTPIDGSAYSNSGSTAGQTATCPTYTTTVDDCLIVKAVGTESGDNSTPFAVWPSSIERYDNEDGPPGGGNSSAGLTVASATQASAGATGTEDVDISGTGSTHWGAYTIAIAPPASSSASYTLTAETGATTLAGDDVAFAVARVLVGDTGATSLAGDAAAFRVGRMLAAETGAATVGGDAAELSIDAPAGYALTAETGATMLGGSASFWIVSSPPVAPVVGGAGGRVVKPRKSRREELFEDAWRAQQAHDAAVIRLAEANARAAAETRARVEAEIRAATQAALAYDPNPPEVLEALEVELEPPEDLFDLSAVDREIARLEAERRRAMAAVLLI